MKTILVNIVPEETRVAVMEDGELCAIEVERVTHTHLVGNIYKGRVQNVLPGMQAAFVEIGEEKNAFLYLGEGKKKTNLSEAKTMNLHVGQSVPVQIVKDATGLKGPRAVTNLSLPGRNIVLMPLANYIGISRRIEDEAERARLHELATKYCPEGMGIIVRTVAVDATEAAIAEDVAYLARLWESISARNKIGRTPTLLYRDADLMIRVVRDLFNEEVDALILDDAITYQRVQELVRHISPILLSRVKLYEEKESLFKRYHLEEEIAQIGARKIPLSSGGFIVIDKTEAFTVIDVNTGKYVGKSNLSDTVYQTNLEAAAQIVKQIRLRDIAGIILIDFIDMEAEAQKEDLLDFLRAAVKHDANKTNIVDVTALGIVEITRKKSRENYESIRYSECPYCKGRGCVDSPETVSIRISRELRRMEKKKHSLAGYEVEVHETIAEELRNSMVLVQLAAEFSTDIKVSIKYGIHPEAFTILQRT